MVGDQKAGKTVVAEVVVSKAEAVSQVMVGSLAAIVVAAQEKTPLVYVLAGVIVRKAEVVNQTVAVGKAIVVAVQISELTALACA